VLLPVGLETSTSSLFNFQVVRGGIGLELAPSRHSSWNAGFLALMARFGPDIALPDLLVALASCERRKEFSKPCGARFTDLADRR
jgi:hypothetical protein